MKQVQLVGITPDDLLELIDKRLNRVVNEITTHLQPKEPKIYLTRQELAEMLSIDVSTIHNWRSKGILEAVQIGGRVFYERKKVEEAIVKLKR